MRAFVFTISMSKPKPPDELPELVQRFFTHHLATQRNLSAHTRCGYRDTFRLFLSFLSRRHRRPIDQLTLKTIDPAAVLAFLEHLETVRGNTPRTRNLRLAAIRTFVRFVIGENAGLGFIGVAQRILAVPKKKSPTRVLGFMTRQEIDAVIAAADPTTYSGRRDGMLFRLLYNTGARISEALQLRSQDVVRRAVHLRGKGRKERTVPIWPMTERQLRKWCKAENIEPDQFIFTNRNGEALSRDGVAFRLALAVRTAAESCPSLKNRRITCHTFRHSCAMALLQAGVALEVIALWLGHAKPLTTHGYVEADLRMKAQCLKRLNEPKSPRNSPARNTSRLLAFLESL